MVKATQVFGLSPEELVGKLLEGVKKSLEDFNLQKKPLDNLDVLTRKETAKKFDVTYQTLNNWAKNGVLVPYRLGTRVYYKKSDVLKSLKKVRGNE